MPEEIILNKRIDELPLTVGPQEGFFLPMWNTLLQRTEKVDAGNFIQSGITGNFEWISDNDPGYDVDVVVTRGGKWWQSQQTDNLNHTPGSDPAWWVEINKSNSFSFWQAGVYADDQVFVFYIFQGEPHICWLIEDEPRPFVSSDFLAEYAAGKWISLTQNITQVSAEVGSGFINFNMEFMKRRQFNTAGIAIDNPKTWALVDDDFALIIEAIHFTMGATLSIQTFPADWIVGEATNAEWDNGAKTWKPLAEGNYTAKLEKDFGAGIWKVVITGPF